MSRLFTLLLILLPFLMQAQAAEANLLGTWNDPALVGSAAYNNTYNDIWGVAAGGHEYAIIGSTAGTHFIDVTDPGNPFEAHFVEGAATGSQIIHRDYHDYQGYLYVVADEGASTLQIIDLANLPAGVDVVYDADEFIRQAHNIFIDSTAARLYGLAMTGGPQGYSALRIYDISEPLNLVYLGEYNSFGGVSASHVHDAYIRDNIGFLNCGNNGFAIVDFTNPDNIETLATMTNYPQSGYNHSGWADKSCQYYYLADETHGSDIKTVDITDIEDIEVINTFDAESQASTSIAHNLLVGCDYLYASYYYDGLQVFDISDPASPQRVLYYDTSSEPDGNNYKGAWGVYPYLPSGLILVSDMQEGLFVFEGMGDNCDPNADVVSCRITDTETAVETTENSFSKINIFPHPVNHSINLNLDAKELLQDTAIKLTDLTGKTIRHFGSFDLHSGNNTFQLDLDEKTSNGFYLLSLENEAFLHIEKVVIQRL